MAGLEGVYEDQQLHVVCEDCECQFGGQTPKEDIAAAGFPASVMLPSVFDGDVRDGTLTVMDLPPAGLDRDDPDAIFERGLYRCHLDVTHMMHGLCRACAGPIEGGTIVCDDHDGSGVCGECGSPFEAWGEIECETCGFAKRLPIELFTMGLAPAVGFLYDHGINPNAVDADLDVEKRGNTYRVEVHLSRDDLENDRSRDAARLDLETVQFGWYYDVNRARRDAGRRLSGRERLRRRVPGRRDGTRGQRQAPRAAVRKFEDNGKPVFATAELPEN